MLKEIEASTLPKFPPILYKNQDFPGAWESENAIYALERYQNHWTHTGYRLDQMVTRYCLHVLTKTGDFTKLTNFLEIKDDLDPVATGYCFVTAIENILVERVNLKRMFESYTNNLPNQVKLGGDLWENL